MCINSLVTDLSNVHWVSDFLVIRLIPTALGVFLGIYLNGRVDINRQNRKRLSLAKALTKEVKHNSDLLAQLLTEIDTQRITYNLDLSIINSTAWEQVDLFRDDDLISAIQEVRFELIHISRQIDAQLHWDDARRGTIVNVLRNLVTSNQERVANLAERLQAIVEK